MPLRSCNKWFGWQLILMMLSLNGTCLCFIFIGLIPRFQSMVVDCGTRLFVSVFVPSPDSRTLDQGTRRNTTPVYLSLTIGQVPDSAHLNNSRNQSLPPYHHSMPSSLPWEKCTNISSPTNSLPPPLLINQEAVFQLVNPCYCKSPAGWQVMSSQVCFFPGGTVSCNR